ncbi:MAG: hypothetical protein L0Y79_10040 [Chlorobi bacterium]|nr:hypothetical protein [Chlorobiota bacterium]MCI0715209.1 hypothetical protein [Chlorobiota bacterium]
MKNSSLVNILRKFTPKEMKEFREFINSPFFNKNKNVIKLYDIIKKAYPKLEDDKLNKEKVFAKLFPGQKYKDSTMRLLMFYLYEAAEKYIVFQKMLSDNFSVKEKLLTSLRERDLLKESQRVAREIEAEFKKTSLKDEAYFMNRFLYDFEYLNLLDIIHIGKYEKYLTKNHTESALRNLTYYYLARALKFYTIIINTQKLLNVEFDFKFFEKIINSINIDDFSDSPVIMLYYSTVMALQKPNEEKYYYEMKEYVQKYEKELDLDNLLDIYVNLENYCIRKSRVGKKEFDKELFEIYRLELDKKLYLHHNQMTHHFYKSVVITSLDLKEFEWTENFIEKYKNEVVAEFRDSAYYFCLSRVELKKKNFEKSLEYLSKVRTDEIYMKTETRLMQGVLFYELNLDDPLNSLTDTLRHFFKNQKFIARDRLIFYHDFVKSLSKLNSLKNKKNAFEAEKLKEQIESKDKVFMKKWLVEKTEELLSNNKT